MVYSAEEFACAVQPAAPYTVTLLLDAKASIACAIYVFPFGLLGRMPKRLEIAQPQLLSLFSDTKVVPSSQVKMEVTFVSTVWHAGGAALALLENILRLNNADNNTKRDGEDFKIFFLG